MAYPNLDDPPRQSSAEVSRDSSVEPLTDASSVAESSIAAEPADQPSILDIDVGHLSDASPQELQTLERLRFPSHTTSVPWTLPLAKQAMDIEFHLSGLSEADRQNGSTHPLRPLYLETWSELLAAFTEQADRERDRSVSRVYTANTTHYVRRVKSAINSAVKEYLNGGWKVPTGSPEHYTNGLPTKAQCLAVRLLAPNACYPKVMSTLLAICNEAHRMQIKSPTSDSVAPSAPANSDGQPSAVSELGGSPQSLAPASATALEDVVKKFGDRIAALEVVAERLDSRPPTVAPPARDQDQFEAIRASIVALQADIDELKQHRRKRRADAPSSANTSPLTSPTKSVKRRKDAK